MSILESDDRIPFGTSYGTDAETGETILYNFWKDAQHPKGIWRKTNMTSYQTMRPEWTTVLDVDALGEQEGVSWVWKGAKALPRARDPAFTGQATRALISLSRGGADATILREFDLTSMDFLAKDAQPFKLPEAKTRASYKSKDVLLVGSDFGPGSLTDSGYPRTVREWVRGTPIEDAPVVFEGESTDVSVFAYTSDERIWSGGIYEVHGRSMTFYTSKYWIRKIDPQHLLAPNQRDGVADPPDFMQLDIQEDADFDLVGNMIFISLRSDWEPLSGGAIYTQGSVVYTHTDTLIEKGAAGATYQLLFKPTERTAYEYLTSTKNYLILSTMDSVKSKLEFFKIEDEGSSIRLVGGDEIGQIRDCSARPLDAYAGSDEFWFTTSDFVTPSTLCLADAAKVSHAPEAYVTKTLKSLPPQYNTDNLEVFQEFATSKDGTQVPFFMIRRKDIKLNGKNPTLLYGYGGFEISLNPHYIATAGVAWLERGGVYVEANIRGGGEFGPKWHQAALKENRNKSYEDFIAVAEHLIAEKVCEPKTLAIRGGSNGGLLMGNMYTMRPDLFGAIHCAVPLLDMQHYHTLLAGASWMAEYGNPDTDDWKFLKQYSPYHNLDDKADYPPILVTTSTRDDRVHPGHARKFVKKLWDMNSDWNVQYYENIEGGHGGAADAKQSAFMLALAYDFMYQCCTKEQ